MPVRDRRPVVASTRRNKDPYDQANPEDISNVGWSNLESKFYELMDLMGAPAGGINALEARAAHRERISGVITALLDRALDECRRVLISGNGHAAEEAGIRVLRLREEFFGKNSLPLVPVYFHIARTKQFLELYGEAEEMLSLAHYIILRNEKEVTTTIKAELHQTYGLLYAADNKLEASVKHLTCATYYLSLIHGPQHVLTTFSFFDLGNVFAAKGAMESAMVLYDTVKEIWYNHLVVVLNEMHAEKMKYEQQVAIDGKRYEEDEVEQNKIHQSAVAFGKDNLSDASKMLFGICRIQRERFKVDHPSIARAEFVLALFLIWTNEISESAMHFAYSRAASLKFYGDKHPLLTEMTDWCKKFNVPNLELPPIKKSE